MPKPTHRQILDAIERVQELLPPMEDVVGPENVKFNLACDIVRAVFEETGVES